MNKHAIGIIQSNSTDYVDKAFQSLNNRNIVINLRDKDATFDLPDIELTETYEPILKTGWYQGTRYQHSETDDLAQILFSSGTEGPPKGICITHKALANTTRRLIDIMQIDDSIREYIGVPVYFSFGFGRCRVVSAVGGEFFIPENGFNPIEISELLESKKINAVSAVPSLWRTILEAESLFETCGQHLKWIEIGSQYMAAAEKIKLRTIFPNAKIVQHYGLTEASRSTFLNISAARENELESVGQGLFGVNVKINEEGRICIQGPHLASVMYKNGKRVPICNEDGWLETSDKGRLEGDHLYFEGRADDMINYGGTKLSPEKIDRQMMEMLKPDKGFCTLKIADYELGERIAIAKERNCKISIEKLQKCLSEILGSYGLQTGGHFDVFEFDVFPYTGTGKLKRQELSEQCNAKKEPPTTDTSNNTKEKANPDPEALILEIWQDALKLPSIDRNESFFDLGGDSLSAIRVMIKMESKGVPRETCKSIFEGRSISELASLTKANQPLEHNSSSAEITFASKNTSRTPLAAGGLTVNVVRGILVILNITAHWNAGLVSRLPPIFESINKFLAPLYSSGTPGFAVIFGVGVGYFILPRYKKNPASLGSLIRRNALILGIGMLVMALMGFVLTSARGIELTGLNIANMFYSVIFFYFFAVISIPFWMRVLNNAWLGFPLSCLIGSTILYCVHLYISSNTPTPSQNPFIQPLILLITAKYNYPEMFSGVLLGALVGTWFRGNITNHALTKTYCILGIILIVFSVIVSVETGESFMWFIWPKGLFLWSWACYLGMTMLMLGLTYKYILIFDVNTHHIFGFIIKVTSIIGIMAFPLFIGHELVLPTVDLLREFNVPTPVPIALCLFLAVASFFTAKLYRLYFGNKTPNLDSIPN